MWLLLKQSFVLLSFRDSGDPPHPLTTLHALLQFFTKTP